MKTMMSKMKYLWDRINDRLAIAEENTGEFEYRATETTQNETVK